MPFQKQDVLLRGYLGRMAFPLFAFLVGEGYLHTSNLKKYYKRLIIFAILSQIPFMLFRTLVGEWKMLNILFTLLFGLACITVFDKLEKKYYLSIPLIAIMIYLGELVNVDYGGYGIACVWVLYIGRNYKFLRIVIFAILNFIYYKNRILSGSIESIISYFFATLPVGIMTFYNGKLGHKTRYLYYIFYPAHMLILYFINLFFIR